MKNKFLLIVIIILLLILLIPIPMRLKDGGSIRFQALLYTVTKYHKLSETLDGNYITGIGIEVLGVEIFDSTDKVKTHTVNTDDSEETINQKHNSFVGTVLEETTTYMIVEPNQDEAERKSADKIRINYGTDHRDYLYGIGRKVIINYTGYIKETYPAQIDSDNILTDGYEDFELIVEEADNTHIRKILNNTELYKNNLDYDLFYVGLNEVNVNVDNKTITLEEALRHGKMTIDGIIKKANQDESDGLIKSNMYKDGGTMEYYYDNYTIIKRHTTEGDRDVYILKSGLTELDISYCREVMYE